MKTWLIPIGAIILTSMFFTTYTKGKSDGVTIERARQIELREVARVAREESARSAAEAIAQIEVKHVTIKQEIQREILEKPVYRECRHDDVGMQLINSALRPRPTGSSELPGPGGAER